MSPQLVTQPYINFFICILDLEHHQSFVVLSVLKIEAGATLAIDEQKDF